MQATSNANAESWPSVRNEAMMLPPPASSALADLVRRFGLGSGAERKLRLLAELLASDPLAPTTVRDPMRVVDDHLADSLVALDLDVVRDAKLIADIGSGAGLPGLPLAVALPGAQLRLLESNLRKTEFIGRAARACGIDNARAIPERAESWREGLGACDVVTARALARLDVVAEYAAPLLKIGGALIAWRGYRDPQNEADAARAAELLGLELLPPVHVSPHALAVHRHLHVIVKVAQTPQRFPRRVGVAAKRPLGAAPAGIREPSR